MPEGDLRDLLVDGVVEGVGGVLVFLPQILLLFLFIGLLESSGYMARAAFLMDGVMSKAGLSGKAFLPLLSSYACAIPGRDGHPHDRLGQGTPDHHLRRPVDELLGAAAGLLPAGPAAARPEEGHWLQALMLFGVYAGGTLTALVVARIVRGRLGPDESTHHFMLELPPYRAPQWGYILRHVADRGWSFVRKAGTLILGLSILLWALQDLPEVRQRRPGRTACPQRDGPDRRGHRAGGATARLRRPHRHRDPDLVRGARGVRLLDGDRLRRRGSDDEEETRASLRERLRRGHLARRLADVHAADPALAAGVLHLRAAMPADHRGGRPRGRIVEMGGRPVCVHGRLRLSCVAAGVPGRQTVGIRIDGLAQLQLAEHRRRLWSRRPRRCLSCGSAGGATQAAVWQGLRMPEVAAVYPRPPAGKTSWLVKRVLQSSGGSSRRLGEAALPKSSISAEQGGRSGRGVLAGQVSRAAAPAHGPCRSGSPTAVSLSPQPLLRVFRDAHPHPAQRFAAVEIRDHEEGLAALLVAAQEGVEPVPAGCFPGEAAEVRVAVVGVVEAVEIAAGEGRLAQQVEQVPIPAAQRFLLVAEPAAVEAAAVDPLRSSGIAQ